MLPPETFEVVECFTQEELLNLITDADALVHGQVNARVNKEIIEAAKRLKFIQRAGRLYDRYIDVDAATKAGIRVATMRMDSAICIAEHVLTLMLALSKNLFQAHHYTVTGAYRNKLSNLSLLRKEEFPLLTG